MAVTRYETNCSEKKLKYIKVPVRVENTFKRRNIGHTSKFQLLKQT